MIKSWCDSRSRYLGSYKDDDPMLRNWTPLSRFMTVDLLMVQVYVSVKLSMRSWDNFYHSTLSRFWTSADFKSTGIIKPCRSTDFALLFLVTFTRCFDKSSIRKAENKLPIFRDPWADPFLLPIDTCFEFLDNVSAKGNSCWMSQNPTPRSGRCSYENSQFSYYGLHRRANHGLSCRL